MHITNSAIFSHPLPILSPPLKKAFFSSSFFAPSIPFTVSSSHIFTAFSACKDLYQEEKSLFHPKMIRACCKTVFATAGAFFVWNNAPMKTALTTLGLILIDLQETLEKLPLNSSFVTEKLPSLLTSSCFIAMLVLSFPEALIAALLGVCLIEIFYGLSDLQKEKYTSSAYHLSFAFFRMFQALHVQYATRKSF